MKTTGAHLCVTKDNKLLYTCIYKKREIFQLGVLLHILLCYFTAKKIIQKQTYVICFVTCLCLFQAVTQSVIVLCTADAQAPIILVSGSFECDSMLHENVFKGQWSGFLLASYLFAILILQFSANCYSLNPPESSHFQNIQGKLL